MGLNEGLKPNDLTYCPKVGGNQSIAFKIPQDHFIKFNAGNDERTIASLKNAVCSFLGTFVKPEKKISLEDHIADIVNNFADKVISLDKTRVNVQNIQDLVNICLPGSNVKVKDMSEFNLNGQTNTYAAYEVTSDNQKNLYVNFAEDVTKKQDYAKLIQALVHEFTHAVQRDSNKQLGRLHNIIKQRGMLNTLNSTFFQLELDLFRYHNSIKQYKPNKQIENLETKELYNYFDTSRAELNRSYQVLLLNSLITRENVDRQLATEFFVSELRDEAQAYKLGLHSEKKILGTEGKFYTYELFNTLLSDMADYLTDHYSSEPKFLDKTDKRYSELGSLLIDIESDFGKATILKHFKELEDTQFLPQKGKDLSVLDFFTDFSRDSLNKFYDTIISENASQYNKKPDQELLKSLHAEIAEIASLVKRHITKVREKYNMENTLSNLDYIPLLYQDFANYLEQK